LWAIILDESEVHKFYCLKPDVDIIDHIPVISPETFYITIDGKVESLAKYFLPRLRNREKESTEFDLTPVVQKPLIVSISLLVGDIYFDKEFVPEAIVGYFNAYHMTSSNPRLVNPRTLANLCMPYTLEDLDFMERSLDEGKSVDRHSFMRKDNHREFIDYLFGAKDRPEDPTSKDATFFRYNGISLKKLFYCYLAGLRVRNFEKIEK
jgi:hypothetical protein